MFFKLKKIKIRYHITKRETLIIIKCIIEMKCYIIKHKQFIMLYINHQILKSIIKININVYKKIVK